MLLLRALPFLFALFFVAGCRPSVGEISLDWSAMEERHRYHYNIEMLSEGKDGRGKFDPSKLDFSFEDRFRGGVRSEMLRAAATKEEEAKGYSVQVKLLEYDFGSDDTPGHVAYSVVATPPSGGEPVAFDCRHSARTHSSDKEQVWRLLGEGLKACGSELARKIK